MVSPASPLAQPFCTVVGRPKVQGMATLASAAGAMADDYVRARQSAVGLIAPCDSCADAGSTRRGKRGCDTMTNMSDNTAPSGRPGWVRDVPVPPALDELQGSLQGSVGLLARLFWSGPHPREVRWDVADPTRRRDLYEIVLVEGTLDDVCELINGTELVRLWDQMYLPPWVRSAWRPDRKSVV